MTKSTFDISKLSEYREDNCLKVKKATNGLLHSIRTALERGLSDPRNATLMKMFSLIGVGERAGSGVPSVIAVWSDVTGMVPTYKQSFAPERWSLP